MTTRTSVEYCDQLELQKARLEEIISSEVVTPQMKQDLRKLVMEISRQIRELSETENYYFAEDRR